MAKSASLITFPKAGFRKASTVMCTFATHTQAPTRFSARAMISRIVTAKDRVENGNEKSLGKGI